MKGITALVDKGGGPWAGGASRVFERTDIRAIGKLKRYGDFITRLMVRLVDGVEVFINASEQSVDDGRWLFKIGRGVGGGPPSREVGWSLGWKEISIDG